MKAMEYAEWVVENREKAEEIVHLGISTVITDSFNERATEEIKRRTAVLMHESMARGMADRGVMARQAEFQGEREIILSAFTQFQQSPESYMGYVYNMWNSAEVKAARLESLTLWGHIKQWWRYRKG